MKAERLLELKALFLESLNEYSGGFASLERLDRDLKSILYSLDEVADPKWVTRLRGPWFEIEGVYASLLDDGELILTKSDEDYVASMVDELRSEIVQ